MRVILNPAACRGDAAGVTDEIQNAFERHRMDVELTKTEGPGHAPQLVAEAPAGGVVVVGGDGTLHEAIQGLDLERHRLGLIPRGSGNDWAWANDWPRDVDLCVDRIARDEEQRLDLGVWTGDGTSRRFHNSIGGGFEAAVNLESQRIRRLRGSAIYVVASLRCLARRRRYPIRMSSEGIEWEGDILQISIGNGPRIGGAFLLLPDARFDDGLLDICRVGHVGFFPALTLLPRTFRGRHVHHPRVTMLRSPWIEIEAQLGLPVHVDGEFQGEDLRRMRAELLPGALRTY